MVRLHTVDECNLVFLSARPHIHKDVSEAVSYKIFRSLVESGRLHTMPSLLPGLLGAGVQALLCAKCTRRAWRSAAFSKARSFFAYAKLYPEYNYVWVGDNGQGDVLAAELMRDSCDAVRACFIHEVAPIEQTLTSLPRPTREAWATRQIYFFRTYVGASLTAFQVGLITAEDVAEVVEEAIGDVESVLHTRARRKRRAATGGLDAGIEELCAELRADIERANREVVLVHLKKELHIGELASSVQPEGIRSQQGTQDGRNAPEHGCSEKPWMGD